MGGNRQLYCFTAVVRWLFREQKALAKGYDRKEFTKFNKFAVTD